MIDTDLVVTAPMDTTAIEALFDHCRHLLGATDAATWRHGPSTHYLPGNAEWEMRRGQGLPAHLRVVYSLGTPIVRTVEPELPPTPQGFVQVHLQSGGFDAADVHTRLITAIGGWLDGRGLCWRWQHEDHPWQAGTGDLHTRGAV